MKNFIVVAIALLTVTTVVGCGGGGGSDNPSPSPSSSAVYPLTARLRTAQSGDTATYTGSGTFSEVGSSGSVPLTASVIDTYTATTFRGAPSLLSTTSITFRVEGSDIVENLSSINRQDGATGDLFVVSTDASDAALTTPVIFLPGTFRNGYSHSADYVYEDGSPSSRRTFTVVGTEIVSTPIGRFETWKAVATETEGDTSSQSTQWFAPQLGTFVKADVIQSLDGGRQTIRFSLALSSVSYPF